MSGRLPSLLFLSSLFFWGCGGSNGHSTGAVSGTPPAPDGGASSNSCDGLRPVPPGQPFSVKSTLPYYIGTVRPLGDGEGNVLTGTLGRFGSVGYGIYSRDAQLIGMANFPPQAGELIVPLASGFAGVGFLSGGPGTPRSLLEVMPDGGVRNVVAVNSGGGVSPDPRGGLVLFANDVLTAYDDALNPRWVSSLPLLENQALHDLAVDVGGNVLILFGTAGRVFDLMGSWVDAAGHPGTPFPVASGVIIDQDSFVLAADARGGFFLWHQACPGAGAPCTSQWQGRYPVLSPTPEAAPAWLSSRPLAALRLIHGNTAYAVTGAPVPACAFEVVTAEGVSCGLADFSAALAGSPAIETPLTANSGTTPGCSAALTTGRDGTVLSLRSRDTGGPCNDTGDCPVSYDWFPGYFR